MMMNTGKALKIKAELQDMPHKTVRKLLVPEDINMWQLHMVLQESLGWFNAHLFEFTDKIMRPKISVQVPFEDDYMDDFNFNAEVHHPHQAKLNNLFYKNRKAKPFWYLYDFGDGWEHEISFLKYTNKDSATFKGVPVCIEAKGKCPPEDVGGTHGYRMFLDAINDPKHPEHKMFAEWSGLKKGQQYSATAPINLQDINSRLNSLYGSEEWNRDHYNFY